MRPFELPVPPPPPSTYRSVADHRPVCKYGKACYNKSPAHLAKFAHPWLDDAASAGSPSPTSERPRHEEAASSYRRISTPPRANELMPPSSGTPPRSRSPREEKGLPGSLTSPSASRSPRPRSSWTKKPICKYGKACRRTNPEHFEEFDHPDLDGPPDFCPRSSTPPSSARPPAPSAFPPPDYFETLAAAEKPGASWGSRMEAAFEKPEPPSAPVGASQRDDWAAESSGGKYKYTPKARGGFGHVAGPDDGASRHGGTSTPTAASSGGSSYSPYTGGASSYGGATAGSSYSHGTAAVGSSYSGGAAAASKTAERGGSSAGADDDSRWGHSRRDPSSAGRHGGGGYSGGGYGGGGYGGGGYAEYRPGAGSVKSKSRIKPSEDETEELTTDMSTRLAEVMRKAKEKSSTLMPNGIVSKLQASVGFIWTVNVILLFAAIVQVV